MIGHPVNGRGHRLPLPPSLSIGAEPHLCHDLTCRRVAAQPVKTESVEGVVCLEYGRGVCPLTAVSRKAHHLSHAVGLDGKAAETAADEIAALLDDIVTSRLRRAAAAARYPGKQAEKERSQEQARAGAESPPGKIFCGREGHGTLICYRPIYPGTINIPPQQLTVAFVRLALLIQHRKPQHLPVRQAAVRTPPGSPAARFHLLRC